MAWAAELRIDDTAAPDGAAQSQDERDSSRHKLYLDAQASAGAQAASVLIHNLSSTGMLLETGVTLTGQDGIDVAIPEVGTVHASIVWSSEPFYGCQFDRPLSRAAVSAAMLRSPSDWPMGSVTDWAASDPVPLPPIAPPEALGAARQDRRASGELSPRAKFFIITGLAIVSWGAVAALAGLVALLI